MLARIKRSSLLQPSCLIFYNKTLNTLGAAMWPSDSNEGINLGITQNNLTYL
jgi:hypothetical protein